MNNSSRSDKNFCHKLSFTDLNKMSNDEKDKVFYDLKRRTLDPTLKELEDQYNYVCEKIEKLKSLDKMVSGSIFESDQGMKNIVDPLTRAEELEFLTNVRKKLGQKIKTRSNLMEEVLPNKRNCP